MRFIIEEEEPGKLVLPIRQGAGRDPIQPVLPLLTPQEHVGPVTDYGATMVHLMRNRHKIGRVGYMGEMERPSPSYIVDVSYSYHFTRGLLNDVDVAAIRRKRSGLRTGQTPSRITEQDQASNQRCPMDSRRPPFAHCLEQRRVYLMEWDGLQFRNYHAGASFLTPTEYEIQSGKNHAV
jgi:hypothetical protein